jgi:phosphatidylserine decarboxylase
MIGIEAALHRIYPALPDRLINRAFARVTAARWPRWLLARVIDRWIRQAGIDMRDFAPKDYASIDEFFLRELRPDARPIAHGVVSPVDGVVVASGAITPDYRVRIKGSSMTLARVVNGKHHHLALDDFEGGSFLVIFLTPNGYHRVHAPLDARLTELLWIPGRYFPQNERALARIPRVHERNERLTMRLSAGDGETLLTMVAASLVGGIHLASEPRARWARLEPTPIDRSLRKGEELGHFSFGSTVVMLTSRALNLEPLLEEGAWVKMGQKIFA